MILDGLPPEFESIVMLINSKMDWFEIDEVKALLLAHEQWVDKQRVTEKVSTLNLTQAKESSDDQGNNSSVAQAHYTNSTHNSDSTQNSGQQFRGNFNPRGRGGRFGGSGGRGGGPWSPEYPMSSVSSNGSQCLLLLPLIQCCL